MYHVLRTRPSGAQEFVTAEPVSRRLADYLCWSWGMQRDGNRYQVCNA